ncbi:uncharacterized protein LOC121774388 [Salvia splendens]|uniref:uncharacterized protein LOC121774388 n=1 Tax=Salvia splendens TaxID=180675 RepID=UPI001C254626|nr:uncharacterized protein LOC121774388 [Salvia splendens]
MEKKLLEVVEKTRASPPPAPKEKTYVPPPPEEHHYYYCEFPPKAEAPNQVNAIGHWNSDGNWVQGKQRDAPWKDHQISSGMIRAQDNHLNHLHNRHSPPKGSPIGQFEFKKDRTLEETKGRVVKGTGQADPGHQGPQSSNSGRQPNNQVVNYIPPHQRGNQQHQGNQPYHQPQYQSEHYGQSDYPQPSHGGGPSNKKYNRHANEGPGEVMAPHHPNDAMRGIQEAQKEQRAALDMLTKQFSQVSMSLGELRGNEGKIPATVQPTGRENISEVSLRSGKSREEGAESSFLDQAAGGRDKGKGKVCGETTGEGQGEATEKAKPYPYRGMITRRRDATIDVTSLFKGVEVEVPLPMALKMPPISKFIKDYSAGKVTEEGRIVIEENVSAVIQRSDLPSKKTDPGMFTLPISIGDIQVEHAMCDLGASINVLPYSIYKKLGEAKPVDTDIMIQLADRSSILLEGILEDVIVKVNNFLYPADFFVIKMTEPTAKESSGVLLGRPFLSTTSTIIDVRNGMISLDFNGEQFTFNIDEAMKRPRDSENVHSVDITEPLVQEYLEEAFL